MIEPSKNSNNKHPAERDAEILKRHYPLSFLLQLLACIFVLVIIMFTVFIYAAGTDRGTAFFIDKLSSESGIELNYTEGNLRDGLLVTDLNFDADDELHVNVDKAEIKIGWKALFTGELHLREASIGHIDIFNAKKSEGKPYDYKSLDFPVSLDLEDVTINKISYRQVGQSDFILKDIMVNDITWSDTLIYVSNGNASYDDFLSISDIDGSIDLQNEYPINAKAGLTFHGWDKAHIDTLDINAKGSLKHTFGTIKSHYNNDAVTGNFDIQLLDKGLPFNAKFDWNDISIPYLKEQDITISDGMLSVSGILSDFEFRMNTDVSANELPNGQYKARGRIEPLNHLQIEDLTAKTDEGVIHASGILDWQKNFFSDIKFNAVSYPINKLIPKDFKQFNDYLPTKLNGNVDFNYVDKISNGNRRYVFNLSQKNGEVIQVGFSQAHNAKPKTPLNIDASWQNYYRTAVPDIGVIDSSVGNASLVITKNQMSVDVQAKVNQLLNAPKGDYNIKLINYRDDFDISSFSYKGVAGDLNGKGVLRIATKKRPLSWEMNANTSRLQLTNFITDFPIIDIKGSVIASGKMVDVNKNSQKHSINFSKAILTAKLAKELDNRIIDMKNGSGHTAFTITDDELTNFDVNYNGDAAITGLPKGTWQVNVKGNPNLLLFKDLKYKGEAGAFNLNGSIDTSSDIVWDLKGKLEDLHLSYFTPSNPAIITGDVKSKGKWSESNNQGKHGLLNDFSARFKGSIFTKSLPKSNLELQVSGNSNTLKINKLIHTGDSGKLNASGKVSFIDGFKWQLDTTMDKFNLGYFVNDYPSQLTGKIITNGRWNDAIQIVNIESMDLSGTLKNKNIVASGSFYSKTRFQNSFNDYLNKITLGKSNNKYQQVRTLIDEISVDKLNLTWGDIHFSANGNQEDLQAKINIPDLSHIYSILSGKVIGGLTIIQNKYESLPTVYVDLLAENIQLPSVNFTNATLKGKLVNLGNSQSQLVMKANDVHFLNKDFNNLNMVFNGVTTKHVMDLSLSSQGAKLSGIFKGGYDKNNMRWNGALGKGVAKTEKTVLTQLQPAQLNVDFKKITAKMAAHCWADKSGDSQFCLKKDLAVSSDKGMIDLSLKNIDTRNLGWFLPENIYWRANVNGNTAIQWHKGKRPVIEAVLYSDNGRFGVSQANGSISDIAYNRVSIIAKSVANGLKIRTDIDSAGQGNGFIDVVVNPFSAEKSINGQLALKQVSLEPFKQFFPTVRSLKGSANLIGNIKGTFENPLFYGDLKISKGSVSVLGLPINLDHINANTKINGTEAVLVSNFMSAKGKGKVKGTIDWKEELAIKLNVKGSELGINQPPVMSARISPDINIMIRPSQKYLNIEGVISVPVATFRPPKTIKNIIAKSNDVVVLDRRLVGNLDNLLAISQPWSINTKIGIDLGSNVVFKGFGTVLPLAGALVITQKDQGEMKAKGMIQVSRSSNINSFGQTLSLNFAQLRFNDTVNAPVLSMEADNQIEGHTVGLRVHGNVNNPNITIFNDAGLTEQQAINALVTGRISTKAATQVSEEGFRSQVTNNVAAAGLSLGLNGTRTITNQIGRAVGLDSLTLSASGNGDDTNVNVTGYITPDLYIRYGIGVFSSQSSLSARYQLTRRVYVEATSAIENFVDVVYRWHF